VGFRSNTAPKLIDVADCFVDLGEIADRIRKDLQHGARCEEREIHARFVAGDLQGDVIWTWGGVL